MVGPSVRAHALVMKGRAVGIRAVYSFLWSAHSVAWAAGGYLLRSPH